MEKGNHTKPWAGLRVVHMPAKPRRSEVVYGITRSMLARAAGISAAEAEKLPMDRLDDLLVALAKRVGRSLPKAGPCRAPKSDRAPELDPYWSTFTLIYSPALDDSAIPDTAPARADLEHAAAQLAAFGTRARVVGDHVRIGRDRYTLWDARRLCVLCEATKKPGEGRKPADRRTFIKLLSALSR